MNQIARKHQVFCFSVSVGVVYFLPHNKVSKQFVFSDDIIPVMVTARYVALAPQCFSHQVHASVPSSGHSVHIHQCPLVNITFIYQCHLVDKKCTHQCPLVGTKCIHHCPLVDIKYIHQSPLVEKNAYISSL